MSRQANGGGAARRGAAHTTSMMGGSLGMQAPRVIMWHVLSERHAAQSVPKPTQAVAVLAAFTSAVVAARQTRASSAAVGDIMAVWVPALGWVCVCVVCVCELGSCVRRLADLDACLYTHSPD